MSSLPLRLRRSAVPARGITTLADVPRDPHSKVLHLCRYPEKCCTVCDRHRQRCWPRWEADPGDGCFSAPNPAEARVRNSSRRVRKNQLRDVVEPVQVVDVVIGVRIRGLDQVDQHPLVKLSASPMSVRC